MPSNTYRKPKGKVIEVYRDKELNHQVEYALLNLFANQKVAITPKKVQRFLNELTGNGMGSESVLIIEQFPLSSLEAHGKFDKLIYGKVGKTGNQYAKRYAKPTNPRSPRQKVQRSKYSEAVDAWNNLDPEEKKTYIHKTAGSRRTGYNQFVAEYIKSH